MSRDGSAHQTGESSSKQHRIELIFHVIDLAGVVGAGEAAGYNYATGTEKGLRRKKLESALSECGHARKVTRKRCPVKT